MKKRSLVGVLLVLLVSLARAAHAQTPPATPANHLQWDEVAQTAAIAGTASYPAFVDGATTGVPLLNVTCVTGSPATTATCTANFPALVPGVHTITVMQTLSGVSSPQSTSLAFTFVVVVTPTGLRVV